MKKCSKCKIEKENKNFHKDRSKKDWLFHMCKVCKSIAQKTILFKQTQKNYRIKNKEKIKQIQKNEYKKIIDKYWSYKKKYPQIDSHRTRKDRQIRITEIWSRVIYNWEVWIVKKRVHMKWCLIKFKHTGVSKRIAKGLLKEHKINYNY